MENFKKEVIWLLKEKYNNKPTEQFKKDIKRLAAGEPLDYVIGFTEFLGCKIDLSKRPLIPRPETEFWVEGAIEGIKNRKPFDVAQGKINNKLFILDMFSGSGCIGIAVLKHIKNSFVVFADNDKNAIKQIKINLKLNLKLNTSLIRSNKGFTNKNKSVVVKSNVFSAVNGKFDFIFANPPYISEGNKSLVQKSVLNFEPHNALFGGGDGLFYIDKFLKQVAGHLSKNGIIFMEFSPEQKKEIEKLLKKFGYKNYKFHKDQYNKWRWVSIG